MKRWSTGILVLTLLLAPAVAVAILRRSWVLGGLLVQGVVFCALVMIGPLLGKTEDDLLPMVRFLASGQLALAAAAGAGAGLLALEVLDLARTELVERPRLRLAVKVAVLALSGAAAACGSAAWRVTGRGCRPWLTTTV